MFAFASLHSFIIDLNDFFTSDVRFIRIDFWFSEVCFLMSLKKDTKHKRRIYFRNVNIKKKMKNDIPNWAFSSPLHSNLFFVCHLKIWLICIYVAFEYLLLATEHHCSQLNQCEFWCPFNESSRPIDLYQDSLRHDILFRSHFSRMPLKNCHSHDCLRFQFQWAPDLFQNKNSGLFARFYISKTH